MDQSVTCQQDIETARSLGWEVFTAQVCLKFDLTKKVFQFFKVGQWSSFDGGDYDENAWMELLLKSQEDIERAHPKMTCLRLSKALEGICGMVTEFVSEGIALSSRVWILTLSGGEVVFIKLLDRRRLSWIEARSTCIKAAPSHYCIK